MTDDDLAHWQGWCGKPELREEVLHAADVLRLAAAIGWDSEALGWPPLGHMACFLPPPGPLGPDGHPARGGFFPPVTLPRRMFLGADIVFHAPLLVGMPAVQMRNLTALTPKSGRSGQMLLATVEISIIQDGQTCLSETQTIVYRDAGPPLPLPVPGAPLPGLGHVAPGPVDLFRFSAATANTHRIHYDLPYAMAEEGYPALVVHGPLVAAHLLGQWQVRHGPPARFSYRLAAPTFAGQTTALQETAHGRLQAMRCDGTVALTATVSET